MSYAVLRSTYQNKKESTLPKSQILQLCGWKDPPPRGRVTDYWDARLIKLLLMFLHLQALGLS